MSTTRSRSHSSRHFSIGFLAMALVGLISTACDSSPPVTDAEVTNEIAVQASVRAVDPITRMITLENEDGDLFHVLAGPEVANFDQVDVGDVLRVLYTESIAVSLKKPGDPDMEPTAMVAADAAEIGEKPAGGIGRQVSATVRIESVDTTANIVTLTGPTNRLRAVRVVTPEGQEFIKSLKSGDRVDIVFTEAVAISIEEQ